MKKQSKNNEKKENFKVILLAVIFDPKNKKILIARRENDPYIKNLTWCFPGGKASYDEDVDKTLKRVIKEKTGYRIKNLGAIFAKTYPERPDFLSIYFLTEIFEGKEKVRDEIRELKWVSPNELENYFTTSFHKKLKQFLNELV